MTKTFKLLNIIISCSIFCFIILIYSSCKSKTKNDRIFTVIFDSNSTIKDSFAYVMFEKGLDYTRNEDFEDAKDYFEKANKAYPNAPVILNALANTMVRTEKFSDASKIFEKALSIDSNYTRTYINYGNYLKGVRKFEDAKKLFYLGFAHNPKYNIDKSMLYMSLADYYYELNQYQQALNFLDSAKQRLKDTALLNKIIAMENQVKFSKSYEK